MWAPPKSSREEASEPKWFIPKISKAEIARRRQQIRPVLRKGKKPFYVKGGAGFTWNEKELQEEAIGLRAVRTIRTLHTWGHYSVFAPSFDEILAQIPEDLLEIVAAAEITWSPSTADDLNREKEALNAGFHVAETTLYKIDGKAVAKEAAKPKTPFAKAILGDDPFDDK